MKLIDIPFKLTEEFLDVVLHLNKGGEGATESVVYEGIGKTEIYVKKAEASLLQLSILKKLDNKFYLLPPYSEWKEKISMPMLKKALSDLEPLKEYVRLIESGKTQSATIKLIKASFNIDNKLDIIDNFFKKYINYIGSTVPKKAKQIEASSFPSSNNFFWIDENGCLIYDEEAHTASIIKQLEKKKNVNAFFIDKGRLESLKKSESIEFDLSRLIRVCEEINDAYQAENFITVGVLIRVILDHVPPIFGKKNFLEVINNYGTKSFKEVMQNLENFNRKLADGMLHTHIKKHEVLPNATTVDCRNPIDLLLGEIINILRTQGN